MTLRGCSTLTHLKRGEEMGPNPCEVPPLKLRSTLQASKCSTATELALLASQPNPEQMEQAQEPAAGKGASMRCWSSFSFSSAFGC